MTLRYPGGFIRASAPTVSASSAVGVWVNSQILPYRAAGTWPQYVPSDPYFEYNTLLLSGNGTNGAQNNTFLDSSTNNFTITRNGNTTQGSFSPFSQTGWGNHFDGNGDYLSIPSAVSTFQGLGANDFSYECFVYPLRQTNTYGQALISYGLAGNVGSSTCDLVINNSGYFQLAYATGASPTLLSPSLAPINQWTHIVVCRSGSTLSMFVNGTRVATASTSATVGSSGNVVYIGNQWYAVEAARQLQGYISNARVLIGSSAYDATSTTITVPTTPLTAITNTKLLTCQSNRFVDNSTNAFAITAGGNTSVEAFSPFNPTAAWDASTNGGSGYFDGSGDYLSIADNAAIDLGTGDFTIECWIYPLTGIVDNAGVIGKRSQSTFTGGDWRIAYATSTSQINIAVAGDSIRSTPAISLNQWNHIAFVRESGTLSCYANGVRGDTLSWAFNLDNGYPLFIGRNAAGYDFPGYIGDVRIVKGSAVYSGATYTVPTAPLTAITNTSLLTNFTNAGIFDATAKNDLETVGNAQISTTQSKFGGSSMYFDGTGDYLTTIEKPLFYFGTEDFTVEAWIYVNDISAIRGIFGQNSGTAATNQFQMVVHTTGRLDFYVYYSSTFLILSSATSAVSTGAWHHVAGVRNGSNFELYLNGVSVASTTASITVNNSVTPLAVGAINSAGTYPMNGYLQDVRITKGIARYTTGFTPPTTAFQLY